MITASQSHVTAAVAFAVMHRNYVAADWAGVLFRLQSEKFRHAFLFQRLQVFHHTHAVAGSVPPIQVSQLFAGHHVALATRLDFAMGKLLGFAAAFDIAVLCSGAAPSAVGYFVSLPQYPMHVGEVGFAYAAIHPARRHKFRAE